MIFKEIEDLIKLVNNSKISFLEIKKGDTYLRVDKFNNPSKSINSDDKDFESVVCHEGYDNLTNNESSIGDITTEQEFLYITSPMVGTFYASSSPDKPAYVSINDSIKSGEVVCIIEAMKLMNEVESEVSGTLVDILVKNGEMVEYGQKIFKIKG